MSIEIERRFLITRLASVKDNLYFFQNAKSKHSIKQGYLSPTDRGQSVRVRIKNEKEASITTKFGRGFVREENKFPVDVNLAKSLFRCCLYRLEKTLYIFDGWEISFYHGPLTGVVIAEYELDSVGEKIPPFPSCFKEYFEVTNSINNFILAKMATDLGGSAPNIVSPIPLCHQFVNPVLKVVITGGPCSGKSTIFEALKKIRRDIHFVPEVATILISQLGLEPKGDNYLAVRKFQRVVHQVQQIFESAAVEQATCSFDKKSAVLFDRGLVDNAAYLSGGLAEWTEYLNTTTEQEYGCYDLVICLDVLPKDVYEKRLSGNPARYENYEQARKLGDRIADVWSGHPHFVRIPNFISWRMKEELAIEALNNFVPVRFWKQG